MSVMTIQIDGGKALWRPGAVLTGSVTWDTDGRPSPTRLEVRLFWFTTGGSAQQVGLMETQTQANPPEAGTQPFRFVLPSGPWSFEGRLARLDWAIEAVLLPEGACARALLSVSPGAAQSAPAQIVRLHPPPAPPPLPGSTKSTAFQ